MFGLRCDFEREILYFDKYLCNMSVNNFPSYIFVEYSEISADVFENNLISLFFF